MDKIFESNFKMDAFANSQEISCIYIEWSCAILDKTFCPYIEKYVFQMQVEFIELLDLASVLERSTDYTKFSWQNTNHDFCHSITPVTHIRVSEQGHNDVWTSMLILILISSNVHVHFIRL